MLPSFSMLEMKKIKSYLRNCVREIQLNNKEIRNLTANKNTHHANFRSDLQLPPLPLPSLASRSHYLYIFQSFSVTLLYNPIPLWQFLFWVIFEARLFDCLACIIPRIVSKVILKDVFDIRINHKLIEMTFVSH